MSRIGSFIGHDQKKAAYKQDFRMQTTPLFLDDLFFVD
jgi:hypothetical protein